MKKMFLMLMLALVAVGFLSATGAAEDEPAADGEPAVVKIATWDDQYVPDQEIEVAFEGANPEIQLEYLVYPAGDYPTVVATQLAGGADIDVFGAKNNAHYTDLVERGVAYSLDEYLQNDSFDLSGFGPLINGVRFNGSVYGLPQTKTAWVLFYNKDLFDAAGVSYPEMDMTWTDFRELASRMTSGDGPDKIWGAYFHTWPICTFGPGLQDGTTIIDEDLSSIEEAFQLRLALEQDGSIMPYYDAIASSTHYNAFFQSGKVAMSVIGSWHVGQLWKAEEEGTLDFSWDVVPIPHPEGVSANTTWGMAATLLINADSDNKDAAWEYLKFRTGVEGARIQASLGILPGYYNAEIEEIFLSGGHAQPSNLAIIPQANVYVEYPPLPGINTIVNTIYKEEMDLMFSGEQSPAETIESIRTRIAEEI